MIYVVRDPRAVFASGKDRDTLRGSAWFAPRWRASLAQSGECAQMFPVHTIRYEDLVSAPQETLARVCEFLGVPFDESLLTPMKIGKPWRGNSTYADQRYRFAGIVQSSIDRWRGSVRPRDVRILETMLARKMEALGYARSAHASAPARLAAHAWSLAAYSLPALLPDTLQTGLTAVAQRVLRKARR